MYCPNCKQEFEDQVFCGTCGTKLIMKPEDRPEGMHISGSTVDMHKTEQNIKNDHSTHHDSHNDHSQHYDNRGQVNVQGTYQVNQVAAHTTEVDVTLKNEERYRAACRRAYEDFVIDANEINELNGLATDLGLSLERTEAILNGVKKQKDAERAREEELTPRAQKRLQRLRNSIRENDIESVKEQVEAFDEMVNEKNISDLHFIYYLAQAVLNYKKCIEIFEKTASDSYWKSYWSYVAYLKDGNKKQADRILDNIESKFRDYSYVNTTLLAATGEMMMGNSKTANKEFMDIDESKLSPCLQRLFDALMLILDPEEAKDNNLREKDYLFYLKHIFNYETTEEREKKDCEEQEKREAEDRCLAEVTRKKAEEEARIKTEQEAKRKSDEERKRKDEEEKNASARRCVTYSVTITGVTNQMLAMMTLRSTMGWGSGDSRQKLSKIPFVAKQFDSEQLAIEFNEKLSKGGMTSTVTETNGLGEAEDCSIINGQAQVIAYKEQERRRKEAEERRIQELHQKELEMQKNNANALNEKIKLYEDACRYMYADGVMTSEERKHLTILATALGLDNATCEQIASRVRNGMSKANKLYDVILVKAGAAKLSVVKTVMDCCNVGLKEAKDLVGGCPLTLKGGLTESKARSIQKVLEEVGAVVKIDANYDKLFDL